VASGGVAAVAAILVVPRVFGTPGPELDHPSGALARVDNRRREQHSAAVPRADPTYRFRTVWRLRATIAEVQAVLSDAAGLPRWWPAVYLDVVPVADGRADGVGRTVEVVTKGWLPYTLRWTLRITETMTDAGFALAASGDLVGAGRWTFAQDGPEVVVTYDWQVTAAKPLLARLSWLLRPAFAANHRWAMARGEESLALELRRRRDPAAEVPPPPGPTFRLRAR
jgi:hypothetical protein